MKRLLAILLMFTTAFAQAAQFSPGQVLTASALNTAFATAQITSGTIDGAVIGGQAPAKATFTNLYLTSPDALGYNATLSSYAATGVPNAALAFRSARGTSAAPAATQTGDLLGNMDFFGYGTGPAYAASLDIVAAGTFTGTSWPTQLNFNATPAGSTVPQLAFTVSGNGIVTASNAFHSNGTDPNGYAFTASSYNSTGAGTGVQLLSARGTAAVPAATLGGDVLGAVDFFGYGTANVEGAAIDAIAGSTWSVSNADTYLALFTTAPNSVTNAERMRINGAGRVLMGTTADDALNLLQVQGSVVSNVPNTAGYNYLAKSYAATGLPSAAMAFQSGRGTAAAPAATQAGDVLGNLDFYGHNGTAPNYAASIDAIAASAFSGTSTPSQLNFNTTTANSTAPTLSMSVSSAGVNVYGPLASLSPGASGYNYQAYAYSAAGTPSAATALYSARGTSAAPAALQAGDLLGRVDTWGHNGTAMANAASITFAATGAFSTTSLPSQINFNTTASGTTTPLAVMSVNNTLFSVNEPVKVTGAITSSGQIHGAIVVTPVAVAGASTLSAANMVGGVIMRSGSTAAYTDTTDTATNIVAAIANAQVGTSFTLRIVNSVAFADTIAAGTGVTLSGTTAIAASSYRDFVGVVTNVATPAVTLYGIGSGTL